MRRTCSLPLLLLSVSFLHAQPAIQWQKCLGGTQDDNGTAVLQTTDGGYLLAASVKSTGGDVTGYHGGPSDAWVVKLNDTGTILWQKAIGGSGTDELVSVQETPDGGYILAGSTTSNNGDVSGNHGGMDAWAVKVSGTGTLEWQKALGGTGTDRATAIIPTSDGGYAVIGYTGSNDGDVSGNHGGFYDAWVVKLDASGTVQWQKAIGGSGSDSVYGIEQTTDGGYVLTGSTDSNDGDVVGGGLGWSDLWAFKLSDTGAIQWQQVMGGGGSDNGYAVRQTADGGYVLAGGTASSNMGAQGYHGGGDAVVIKLSGTGTLQWMKAMGGSDGDGAMDIRQTPDGGYILCGYTESTDGDVTGNHGDYDAWVVKTNGAGTIQWQRALGGTEEDRTVGVLRTDDGGFILAGTTESSNGDVSGNHGSHDVWAVKLAPDQTGVDGHAAPALALYPDPTTGPVRLSWNNAPGPTTVSLLDATGRLLEAHQVAGGDHVLDLGGHRNGMYLVRLRFADGTEVSRRVVKR